MEVRTIFGDFAGQSKAQLELESGQIDRTSESESVQTKHKRCLSRIRPIPTITRGPPSTAYIQGSSLTSRPYLVML